LLSSEVIAAPPSAAARIGNVIFRVRDALFPIVLL